MSEELKCPYCEGTASIAYNNLLYCHDCKRTFSERDAKIMKQAARIEELEDTVRKLTGRERILGDETILYAAHKETIAYKDKQIAELEKRVEACKLANRVLRHKQKELRARLNQWRKVLEEIAGSNNGVDEDGLSCFFCDHMIYIAQKALKGEGE